MNEAGSANSRNYKNLKSVIFVTLFIIVTIFLILSSTPQDLFFDFDTRRVSSHGNINAIPVSINSDELSPKLYSQSAILVNLNNNSVIFEHNSEKKIYPASMTKIMTAILAIESIKDLNKTIIVPENIFPDLYSDSAMIAGFEPNESARAIDLLYGAMLPSGAECSKALALHISNTEVNFIKLMNDKAKELGMKNTNFTNVWGGHDDDHYSTVKDISELLKYALKNKTFSNIFTSVAYSSDPTEHHPSGIFFCSSMFKKMSTNIISNGKIIGGKTGFTDQAGLCLASLAEKNNNEFILVTAGAPGNNTSKPYHILDALTVYNSF